MSIRSHVAFVLNHRKTTNGLISCTHTSRPRQGSGTASFSLLFVLRTHQDPCSTCSSHHSSRLHHLSSASLRNHDADSSPCFDEISDDTPEDELAPWVDHIARARCKADDLSAANRMTSWILRQRQIYGRQARMIVKHHEFWFKGLVDTGLCVCLWLCCCRDRGECLSPVCCCRDPGDCLSLVLVWFLPLLLLKDVWSGTSSDGFQTQRRGSWIPGKERAEKVLADAIPIDGRKAWICKFCS